MITIEEASRRNKGVMPKHSLDIQCQYQDENGVVIGHRVIDENGRISEIMADGHGNNNNYHKDKIKELYTNYYAELEQYERENNTGNCSQCTTIRNSITKVIESE